MRSDLYIGPGQTLNRSDLQRLEDTGLFIAERKKDGVWGAFTASPASKPDLISRTGLTFNQKQLDRICLGQFNEVVLIGEAELMTQAAIRNVKKNGYIRFWLFDLIECQGYDFTEVPFKKRTDFLRKTFWPALSKQTQKLMPLVEQATENFTEFYDRAIQEGDEGVVLKKKDSLYKSYRSTRKTQEWIKIKPWATIDYVVMGVAKTESGSITAQLGLYDHGTLKPVYRYQFKDMKYVNGILVRVSDGKELVGQVVEMEGREQQDSGAIRSAQFVRWRDDKPAEECTADQIRLVEK